MYLFSFFSENCSTLGITMKSFFVLSLFVALAVAIEKPEDDNNAVRVTVEVRKKSIQAKTLNKKVIFRVVVGDD